MVKQIKNGKDILSPYGLPNIKLVKTRRSEWILFDVIDWQAQGKNNYVNESKTTWVNFVRN